MWAFSVRRSVSGSDSERFIRLVQAALGEDSTVSEVRCETLDVWPIMWSMPVTVGQGENVQPAGPESPECWIDVSFHVSAHHRKRAYEIGIEALDRALTTAGETEGYYTGQFDVRPIT